MPNPDGTLTAEEKRRQQPGASGYVNFAQRFGANQAVAQREAGKYANQAQTAAEAAQKATQQAQQKFSMDSTAGTVQPMTNVGASAPVPTTGAGYTAAASQVGNTVVNRPATGPGLQQNLGNESTRPGATNQALSGESTRPAAGPSIADMLARAKEQYSGPEGLDTADAAAKAQQAQQQLGAIGSDAGLTTLVNQGDAGGTAGADALSGVLIGTAGRPQFAGLRARFNPNKDLLAAQDAAIAQAKQARATSEANAKGWGDAAAQAGATKAEMDAVNAKNDAAAAERRAAGGPVSYEDRKTGIQDYLRGVAKNKASIDPASEFLQPQPNEDFDSWVRRIGFDSGNPAIANLVKDIQANRAQLEKLFAGAGPKSGTKRSG
jgi:hypothetical protein